MNEVIDHDLHFLDKLEAKIVNMMIEVCAFDLHHEMQMELFNVGDDLREKFIILKKYRDRFSGFIPRLTPNAVIDQYSIDELARKLDTYITLDYLKGN